MLATLPDVQDAFAGPEIVVHLKTDRPLDLEKFEAALEKHEVKLKQEPRNDARYLL